MLKGLGRWDSFLALTFQRCACATPASIQKTACCKHTVAYCLLANPKLMSVICVHAVAAATSFLTPLPSETQVWKSTTQLGCGMASCGGRPLYVCLYSPPGNVRGRYAENVLPPTSG